MVLLSADYLGSSLMVERFVIRLLGHCGVRLDNVMSNPRRQSCA